MATKTILSEAKLLGELHWTKWLMLSDPFGLIALSILDFFVLSKEPNFTMQSGSCTSCTSCTCTFFFHFRDLSSLDKLGSLARWVATVFSTWLWSTSMVLQLQHHRSRLWVVPRKSHQDSFYLVPSKASNLDHSTCSMHIMYREHLCFLFDMHVVEDFSAWKAFSCSEIVFFSQEQASLVQEDHGDNHGAEHGGCLGFHWNHGVFVLLHFDLSDSFLHVQSQGKSRIHCCFNMLFLLRKKCWQRIRFECLKETNMQIHMMLDTGWDPSCLDDTSRVSFVSFVFNVISIPYAEHLRVFTSGISGAFLVAGYLKMIYVAFASRYWILHVWWYAVYVCSVPSPLWVVLVSKVTTRATKNAWSKNANMTAKMLSID